MKYSQEQIAKLRQKAENYGLDGINILENFTDAALSDIANGIGAEWMPDWSRALTNGLHPSLEAAAMIHDAEYHIGGSSENRKEADERFLANCFKSAETAYSWWDIRRYLAKHSGKKFYNLLRCFGSWAWNNIEVLPEETYE